MRQRRFMRFEPPPREPLAPDERRRAPLRKGLQPFAQVIALRTACFTLSQPFKVDLTARDFVQRQLHAAQRQRCALKQRLRHRLHRRVERARFGHPIQVAQLQQFLRRHRLRQQEQAFGGGQPEARDITLQAAGVVVQTQPRGRHAQRHAGDADAEVAGQRQVGGAADDVAVEARDGGHRQRLERVDGVFEQMRVVPVGVGLRQFADVETGAEQTAAAGEHDDSQSRVGGQLFEVVLQREQVFAVQPVEVPRPVERDGGAARRLARQQRWAFGAHFNSVGAGR